VVTKGLVVKLTAKAGQEDALRSFLAGALPLADAESGTPIWLALRTDASTFWIVDAFPGEPERRAHLQGQIAAALLGRADELLGAPPEINQADVLAAKPGD
jgi:hypothetical protein